MGPRTEPAGCREIPAKHPRQAIAPTPSGYCCGYGRRAKGHHHFSEIQLELCQISSRSNVARDARRAGMRCAAGSSAVGSAVAVGVRLFPRKTSPSAIGEDSRELACKLHAREWRQLWHIYTSNMRGRTQPVRWCHRQARARTNALPFLDQPPGRACFKRTAKCARMPGSVVEWLRAGAQLPRRTAAQRCPRLAPQRVPCPVAAVALAPPMSTAQSSQL